MTTRLYYDDPWRLEFEAEVVGHATLGERAAVVLDRTAFYPEGGGQLPDGGVLGGVTVADVQVDDGGRVLHAIDGAAPAVGARITGSVDRARRRTHMAQHTGQHMLSRALEDVAGGVTVSARLGGRGCTIDLDRDGIPDGKLAEAEALVNAIIDDDKVVRAWFPEPGELAGLPLRRAPKVTEGIRLIDAGGFDLTPCGGTHCTRTGQVGTVTLLGVERAHGKQRIVFEAGPRARALAADDRARLATLATVLGAGAGEMVPTIEKLRGELAAARAALGVARAQLAEVRAGELAARATAGGVVTAFLAGAPVELLRMIAKRVLEVPGAAVVLVGEDEQGHPVLAERAAGATLDCGALVKKLTSAGGGRGGGRPERAEGRLPAGAAIDALLRGATE